VTDTTDAPTPQAVAAATAELLGALAYGQLRAIEAAARLIAVAPDAGTADGAAVAVGHELDAYRALLADLEARTGAPAELMDGMKPHFDAYFDRAPLGDSEPASPSDCQRLHRAGLPTRRWSPRRCATRSRSGTLGRRGGQGSPATCSGGP
jgi:hypothetical protein